MERCFYKNSIKDFLNADENSIFGLIDKQAHGVIHTTSRDAWEVEISIMNGLFELEVFLFNFLTIAIGEFVCVTIFGVLLFSFLKKNRDFFEFIVDDNDR